MKTPPAASAESVVAQLCPHCALCCNGVLFKDVELRPGDDAKRLKSLQLAVAARRGGESKIATGKFPQPCAALDGCLCRIYESRPGRCRQFECALLMSVQAGEIESAAALRVIHEGRRRAEKVLALLCEAGDADESRPLSLRFKRTKKHFESSQPNDAQAETFSRLTLAVHDLNLLLRAKFYP